MIDYDFSYLEKAYGYDGLTDHIFNTTKNYDISKKEATVFIDEHVKVLQNFIDKISEGENSEDSDNFKEQLRSTYLNYGLRCRTEINEFLGDENSSYSSFVERTYDGYKRKELKYVEEFINLMQNKDVDETVTYIKELLSQSKSIIENNKDIILKYIRDDEMTETDVDIKLEKRKFDSIKVKLVHLNGLKF